MKMEIETPNCEKLPVIKEDKKSDLTLEILDNEPGYYQYVIRPMLLPGHEGELCTWLKEMGLMRRSLRCNDACTAPMRWTQARILDKYQWRCHECDKRRPIRDESFFKLAKCSLSAAMRAILGWCKDVCTGDLVEVLKVRELMIRRIYHACDTIAERYVKQHLSNWRIGGQNTLVIVDIYPDGCAKVAGANTPTHNNNPNQILCIAEVKSIPTNYWFQTLPNDLKEAKEEALRVIQSMVRPGSIILADPNAKIASDSDIRTLKGYPTVVSIQDLTRHNREGCTILQNLETIWEAAVLICEEAQNYPQTEVQSYLHNMMWRRKFARTPSAALESLLHHIADYYPSGCN